MNDIKSSAGETMGQWNGEDVNDLKAELARIKKELISTGAKNKVRVEDIPHRDQFPEDLRKFTAYLLWGCDKSGMCLVGSGANRLESVESIREFYANEIAKDALARNR